MSLEVENKDFDFVTSLFVWAYNHDIEVLLYKQKSYGDVEYPMMRFTRGDLSIERDFYPFSYAGEQAKHLWQEVGYKLLVKPPKFKETP